MPVPCKGVLVLPHHPVLCIAAVPVLRVLSSVHGNMSPVAPRPQVALSKPSTGWVACFVVLRNQDPSSLGKALFLTHGHIIHSHAHTQPNTHTLTHTHNLAHTHAHAHSQTHMLCGECQARVDLLQGPAPVHEFGTDPARGTVWPVPHGGLHEEHQHSVGILHTAAGACGDGGSDR
jgi:hypothetical protein